MLLEIASSILVGAGLGYMKLKEGKNEAAKIERIAKNCGLFVKEGGEVKTIQLLRRTKFDGGVEYAFRIPLGLSFSDFQKKLDHFQDGLNNKKTLIDVNWNDIKEINLKGDIKDQIQTIVHKEQIRKEIEMEYDGLLKIRIFNKPLTTIFPYTEEWSTHGWAIPIGTTRQGMIWLDTDTFQMILVAGIPRYGKTVFQKLLISHLIHKHPKNVKFTLLDLKGGLAFNRFKDCSQVNCVAQNAIQSLEALKKVQADMEKQMARFLAQGYEDIKESNYKDRYFIIVDEGAELSSSGETDTEMKKVKKECESILSDIARRGSGIGFRLVYCTQYPTSETIPRQVRRNAVARLCFPLDTGIASQTVLDEEGAESLPLIQGRAILKTDKKHTIQTTFISNDQIHKIIKNHIVRKVDNYEEVQHRERGEGGTNTFIIEET